MTTDAGKPWEDTPVVPDQMHLAADRPNRRPTLRDVAEQAQVSFKTVARVANGDPGVRDATRTRVQQVIEELGYRPDARAANLRSSNQRSDTIGFVQIDAANPFSSAIFRGLEDAAREHGLLVLSGSSDNLGERQQMLVSTLLNRRVDGLVVVPSAEQDDALSREIRRGTPVVFVDREPPEVVDGTLTADVIRTDHRQASVDAVTHLVSHGHRRIGFLGTDSSGFSATERLTGYRQAMEGNGLTIEPGDEILGVRSADQAQEATRKIFESESAPTALFSSQNLATMGAVRALHAMELRHRVAHVGLDELNLAEALDPPLTLVPQSPREIGRLAGLRLIARIQDPGLEPKRTLLHPALAPGGSGEIPPPS